MLEPSTVVLYVDNQKWVKKFGPKFEEVKI